MKLLTGFIVAVALVCFSVSAFAQDVAQHLQDVSVTIRTNTGQGSGVIVTREYNGQKVNFVWTAGHVVDGLRSVRSVLDPTSGTVRQVVEFKDAEIVKELVENGRRVGELKMDARVLKFSDFTHGEDLALLEIRKKSFALDSAEFYLEGDQIPKIGTPLIHVGSLLGQVGANSMTTGIMSQVGRVLEEHVFDQTTVTAFPGSSGGGVFLQDGRYCGMLVRGAGETFNLIVPVRRMSSWAKLSNVEWALDPKVPVPSDEERAKMLPELTFKQEVPGAGGTSQDKVPAMNKRITFWAEGDFNIQRQLFVR